ncbi:MAG: monooxygenase FAD-binding [Gammaproteobacteria bacterium]|jgi:2-polyprenyl-6-methoxyphenol hydroxylase-like FAD-dependent oxidoreductase|nr:monooxygenase FAD-binding [Gammaproteobacteria bacterium]
MTNILIVGAGPTGLTLANELARLNIPFRIIDKLSEPVLLSKALAVQARTLELLERFPGVSEKMLAHGLPLVQGKIYAQKKLLAQIELKHIPSHYPFVLSLAQSQTEFILTEHLKNQGYHIERDIELVSFVTHDNQVHLQLKNAKGELESITVSWLIACDGAHSIVRQQLNLPFEGSTFDKQRFVLADVRLNQTVATDELKVFLECGNILGCFPLPGRHMRLIAEQPKERIQGEFDIKHLQLLIHEMISPELKIEEIFWFSEFHINQRKVSHYRAGPIFMLGDAAHIHSPVGGQGMNTGMQDAINLAWKLAFVIHGFASQTLLESYDTEREAVASQLLSRTKFATKMVLLKQSWLISLRNFFLKNLLRVSAFRKKLLLGLSQLEIHYAKSALSSQHLPKQAIQAGDRWPDAVIMLNQIKSRWYQVLSWSKWNIILVDVRQEEKLKLQEELKGSEQKFHWTIIEKNNCQPRLFPGVYVVRPDAYLGYCGKASDVIALKKYFENL